MNRQSSKIKIKSKSKSRGGSKGQDFMRILSVLKKLEKVFRTDGALMLQCAELLVRENTLSLKPSPTNVCKWCSNAFPGNNISLSAMDARALLSYVSLQLAKNPNLKHCSLLPPSKSEQNQWLQGLRAIAQHTSGGRTFRDGDEDGSVQVFPVEQHKLQKKKTMAMLRTAEDPTRHMFPALPSATPASQQQPKSILKVPRHGLQQPLLDTAVGDSTRGVELSPIKFKKTSTSMAYKKFGSFNGLDGSDCVSVADMVVLAKKKQHLDKLRRQHEEEMNFGKNSIDYGLIQRQDSHVSKVQPKLKEISYHDRIDKQLFGSGRYGKTMAGTSSVSALDSPKTKMSKAKIRFQKDSSNVADEVYAILGVRADKTVRPRKY